MSYYDLNIENLLFYCQIPDGYNGGRMLVSVHDIGGELWIRANCGCYPYTWA